MTFEVIGWVALALNLWGNLALTKKDQRGWLIRLACNAAWVIFAAAATVWPLLANHLLFAGVNVIGWQRWRKEHGNTDER